MRRLIDEIVVRDSKLMLDIIHALENNKHTNYEVDMTDKELFNENTGRRIPGECFVLKVYEKEDMTEKNNAVQLSMDLK